jgi:hypothetical protein
MKEIRNAKKDLVAFQFEGEAKTAFEVLATRQLDFEQRSDSNFSDIKYAQATQAADIKKLFVKINEAITAFHETLAQVRQLGVKTNESAVICAEYAKRKIEHDANMKLIKWAGSVIGGVITLAIGIWAKFHKS